MIRLMPIIFRGLQRAELITEKVILGELIWGALSRSSSRPAVVTSDSYSLPQRIFFSSSNEFYLSQKSRESLTSVSVPPVDESSILKFRFNEPYFKLSFLLLSLSTTILRSLSLFCPTLLSSPHLHKPFPPSPIKLGAS